MSNVIKVFVAGHRGMVGSAIVRQLEGRPDVVLLTRSSTELDLRNQAQVMAFFEEHRPDQVYLAAAKVGGILANRNYPADFLYDNLLIEANVIEAARQTGTARLLFMASSCVYPTQAEQPIAEEALLTGPLDPNTEPYAIAKIAGLKLCESYERQYGIVHATDFRCVVPSNVYGPGDNYHPDNSHVVAALLRRCHIAKVQQQPVLTIWGSGKPAREFLHVDDLALACVKVMQADRSEYDTCTTPRRRYLNAGAGTDLPIATLAQAIAKVVGYAGKFEFDLSKPDGTMRKLLDSTRLRSLGWSPELSFESGLRGMYEDYLARYGASDKEFA
ncbi:GDP-L-fucose synthase family protein [Orrella marina]|uniref:GDP-L-fucose synthase n=1 Tax=Orrella marina TaxID=2163011 RepID=A0A2R4XQ09_9BURK|nr:GDP-L-fucose synthase [Orrella marina]AWB35769.1 GDP-fucose synthetase [Orrella marina]